MNIIKWGGLEILCSNYDILNGFVIFKFGQFEVQVPESEVEF